MLNGSHRPDPSGHGHWALPGCEGGCLIPGTGNNPSLSPRWWSRSAVSRRIIHNLSLSQSQIVIAGLTGYSRQEFFSGCTLGSPPSWANLEDLPKEVPRRYPDQMPNQGFCVPVILGAVLSWAVDNVSIDMENLTRMQCIWWFVVECSRDAVAHCLLWFGNVFAI